MRWLKSVAFGLMFLMTCCATRAVVKAPEPKVAAVVVRVDVDVEPWQMKALEEAGKQWRTVSGGRVQFVFSANLDMSDMTVQPGDTLLVLLDSGRQASLVAGIERQTKVPAGALLGVTVRPPGAPDTTIVFLVADRLTHPLDFIGTAEHELWHALGNPHYDDYKSGVLSAGHEDRVWQFTKEDIVRCKATGLCP
jgi:hypothetical protein